MLVYQRWELAIDSQSYESYSESLKMLATPKFGDLKKHNYCLRIGYSQIHLQFHIGFFNKS